MRYDFLQPVEGGISLSIYLAPRASRDEVVGIHDGRLKVAIAAPPVDNQANEHLIEFFASFFGVSKRSVVLKSGDHSKRKTLLIQGVTQQRAEGLLDPVLSDD